MSEASASEFDLPEEPAARVAAVLEEVVDALDLDAQVEVDEDGVTDLGANRG